MISSKQLKKEYIMTKLKTPDTFETDKCTNTVDKFVYWFDEYLKLKLSDIASDNDALRHKTWSIVANDIPKSLIALATYTWLKFDYFINNNRRKYQALDVQSLQWNSSEEKEAFFRARLIGTNTFLPKEQTYSKKQDSDKLIAGIEQSNYLAAAFAQAGWILSLKQYPSSTVRYNISWKKPNKDYAKVLPTISAKYTARVITPVTAPKVKLQLSFNQKEFYQWFNQELKDFYASLSKADRLKYSIDKEVIIDISQIPKKYYELITDVPVQGDRYIDFVEPFVELLRANNWEIKPESLGNTITLVYTGKNN